MTTYRTSAIHRVGCATITVCTLAAAQVTNPLIAAPAVAATGRIDTTAVQFTSLSTFLTATQHDVKQKLAVHLPAPTPTAADTVASPTPAAAIAPTPVAAIDIPSLISGAANLPIVGPIVTAVAAIPSVIVAGAVISVFISGVLVTGFLSSIPGLYQLFAPVPQLGSALVAALSFAGAPIVAVGLVVGGLVTVATQLLKAALPALPLPFAATPAGAPAPLAAVKSPDTPAAGTSTDTTADLATDTKHRAPMGSPIKRPAPMKPKGDAANPATALASSDDQGSTHTKDSPKPGRQTTPRSDAPSSSTAQHDSPKSKKPKGNPHKG